MKIGIYASIIASERGYERNVSGHIQIPVHTVRLLREAGHEVHLITNRFGPNHTLPACMPADTSMHYVVDGRRRPDLLRGGRPREGLRVSGVVRQLAQIRGIVRSERLEVLHVFGYMRSAMLGGVLRLLGLPVPVVATLVGGNLPPRVNPITRLLLRRLNGIVTATTFTADLCARLGLPSHVVRHGIVRDLAAELGDEAVGPRHRVLFWRDPTRDNGADVCLRAYEELADEFPDVSFDLAIRPAWDEIEGIDALAARHENVHVYRFPYAEGVSIPKLMAESLVVLLPFRKLSVDPQLAIAESLGAGVPVITTDLRSNPELIEPGVSGEIVPVGEVEPVVSALRGLLRDRQATVKQGRVTAERFHRNWNWETYVDDLEAVYRQVQSGRAPAPTRTGAA